jgi:hypothetical protein
VGFFRQCIKCAAAVRTHDHGAAKGISRASVCRLMKEFGRADAAHVPACTTDVSEVASGNDRRTEVMVVSGSQSERIASDFRIAGFADVEFRNGYFEDWVQSSNIHSDDEYRKTS